MGSVLVWPHAAQVYVLTPSALSVGSFVTTPPSQMCPVAASSCDCSAPQIAQVRICSPLSVHVGSATVCHSP